MALFCHFRVRVSVGTCIGNSGFYLTISSSCSVYICKARNFLGTTARKRKNVTTGLSISLVPVRTGSKSPFCAAFISVTGGKLNT